jgi:ATP-binding cassette subfamily C (CFTR/MRP) protein 1
VPTSSKLLSVVNVAVQVECVILWSTKPLNRFATGASYLSLLRALAVVVLVWLEHTRSIRPSTLILIYVLAALFVDIVQARTLLIRGYSLPVSGLLWAGIAVKATLLLLESLSKQSCFKSSKETYSPEEVSGVFSRSVFWWLNSLFIRGSKDIVAPKDLFPLDHDLSSERLQLRVIHAWEKCKQKS